MKRHHWLVRVTHWVNVVAVTIMVGSGLRIFNAYPAFAPRGGSFCCYPFEHKPIPAWLTFGGWLAGARGWHFAMMWVLAINGLIYLTFIYLRGEQPRRPKYHRIQGLAYRTIPLIAIVLILTGLAIWKPVQLAWLTWLFGGYVWARYWHFMAMLALVAFTIGHVFMVLVADPHSLRSMLTGRYDKERV